MGYDRQRISDPQWALWSMRGRRTGRAGRILKPKRAEGMSGDRDDRLGNTWTVGRDLVGRRQHDSVSGTEYRGNRRHPYARYYGAVSGMV